MSFHDQLAHKALLNGHTSQQFHHADQKHAHATWFYLLIAGLLWYFTNWMWALIPGVLAAFVACQSISATLVAIRLEKLRKPAELYGAARGTQTQAVVGRPSHHAEDHATQAVRTRALNAQSTSTVQCWRCKTPIPVTPEVRGQRIQCPSCRTKQVMPL